MMISRKRALQLRDQADRLEREIVKWHGTPHAARAATAYARTIDRLIAYKIQRAAHADRAADGREP